MTKALFSKKFDNKLVILTKLVKCAHYGKWCAPLEILLPAPSTEYLLLFTAANEQTIPSCSLISHLN